MYKNLPKKVFFSFLLSLPLIFVPSDLTAAAAGGLQGSADLSVLGHEGLFAQEYQNLNSQLWRSLSNFMPWLRGFIEHPNCPKTFRDNIGRFGLDAAPINQDRVSESLNIIAELDKGDAFAWELYGALCKCKDFCIKLQVKPSALDNPPGVNHTQKKAWLFRSAAVTNLLRYNNFRLWICKTEGLLPKSLREFKQVQPAPPGVDQGAIVLDSSFSSSRGPAAAAVDKSAPTLAPLPELTEVDHHPLMFLSKCG